MADEIIKRDDNRITVLAGVTDDANLEIKMLRVDPTTKRLLVSATVSTSLGITIDTTTITGGTTTRILYDKAGVVGEYTISGSGTVVAMATAPTFATSITGSYLTISEMLITDASKNIVSAPVATYPSLTELTYLKGVTSGIQTQLGAKAPIASPTFTGTVSGITKAMVGLTNVDDTSDATKNSATTTLTNKRINPRLVTAASYTTDTGTSLSVATCDQFEVTAQAGALKLNNPGGTPTGGQKLIVRIKDDGTARALTYDTYFRAMGVALPSTTVLSKTLYMGFIFNATDTKWDLVAAAQEA